MSAVKAAATIHVEVVFATPARQALVGLDITPGSSIADAIEQSGIAALFNDFDLAAAPVGVFGQKATREHTLRDGDRVEIYRPLLADPKEVRRQRALQQAGG